MTCGPLCWIECEAVGEEGMAMQVELIVELGRAQRSLHDELMIQALLVRFCRGERLSEALLGEGACLEETGWEGVAGLIGLDEDKAARNDVNSHVQRGVSDVQGPCEGLGAELPKESE